MTATLIRIDGRRATFQLEAFDAKEKIAEGEHERVVIDMARFLGRVEQKREA